MRRNGSLAEDWRHLRQVVEEIEADIIHSPSMQPTALMVRLLILGEDRRFYWHLGADPFALLRASWKTFHGIPQGGSTIAMQLVRTLTGNYERTYRRKLREIILAVMITSWKGRIAIPSLYLWVAYYGWRMNGIKQAYMRLGSDHRRESLQGAAELVARLKYPEPSVQTAKRAYQIDLRARYLMSLVIGAEKSRKFVQDEKWNRLKSLRRS